MLKEGATLAGRFQIIGLSRSGAMAAVFKARDLLSGRSVALKVLYGDFDEQVARFEREADVLAELDHPAIVKYVAHGTTPDGGRYLAMEWLRGEDLQRHLSRVDMTVGESTRLVANVADGLAVTHDLGVVHRDIKPGNLFLEDGKTAKVKLIDFGIAMLSQGGTLKTDPSITLGSPGYMAPEQAQSGLPVDHRADIFSLGCVLFRCLAGRRPFVGDSPMAIMAKTILEEAPRLSDFRKNIPGGLDDLVARMLANDPNERPRTARAVARELHTLAISRVSGKLSTQRIKASITTGEQRLLSVVMAKLPRSKPDTSKGRVPTVFTVDKAAVEAAVQAHGGKTTKLANGFLLITIKSKGSATEQSTRAAQCALRIRELMQGSPVALATGSAQLSAQPVGEVIERAVALLRGEQNNDYVRVDNITASLLGARFDVVSDDLGLTVRGERLALEATRTLLGKPTPCVGRIRELGFLDAIFEETAGESTANAVLVVGATGIGKSRLRAEFVLNLQGKHDNLELWFGRGEARRSGVPFGTLGAAIQYAAGFLESDSLEVRRDKLRTRAARYIDESEVDQAAMFLGEMIGLRDDSDPDRAPSDPSQMHSKMRQAWEAFLGAELEHHPVVLVIEDLQWGDLPSVRFIDEALRAFADRPLMVLALARPQIDDMFPTLWRERDLTRMTLQELTARASRTLIHEVLGDSVAKETVAKIVKQAAGNAFYLEELIRSVAQGTSDSMPESVLAMAQARIEALHQESRRVLRAASVFGSAFAPSGVEQLLGGPDEAPNVGQRLAQLAQKELITLIPNPPDADILYESHFAFRHDLVREAAYSMLTDEDRILGHRLAAEWLVANQVDNPYVLADHFEHGGEPVRAVKYFRIAAEQALDGNDVDTALRHAERGAACGATGEDLGLLRLIQSEACRWQGQHADGARFANEARKLLRRTSPAWFRATGLTALAAGTIGDWSTVASIGDTLAEMSPADGTLRDYLLASARCADRLFFMGRYEQAEILVGIIEGTSWHPTAQEPAVLGWLHRLRAYRSLFYGDLYHFVGEIEEAAMAFDAANEYRSALLQRAALGYGYLHLGAHRRAREILETVRETALELELHNLVTSIEADLGLTMARLGAVGEARHMLDRSTKSSTTQTNPRVEGIARANLAEILLMQGEFEAAEMESERAVDLLENFLPARGQALATAARIQLSLGEHEMALKRAEDAIEILESLGGVGAGENSVRLIHAEALHAMGEIDEAREAIALARERLNEHADNIENDELRDYFIFDIPDNGRTVALAREWD